MHLFNDPFHYLKGCAVIQVGIYGCIDGLWHCVGVESELQGKRQPYGIDVVFHQPIEIKVNIMHPEPMDTRIWSLEAKP